MTVERVLAERSGLREQAEIDKAAAREERVATKPGLGNVAEERTVPTLEELVAEKADELRTRTLAQRERKDSDDALGDSGGNNVHVDDLGICVCIIDMKKNHVFSTSKLRHA